MRRQTGFTLIEIAIVLVIIGLLLGGVLKGQELITSARVRNLISQQDGVKAAYFGFLDRFRALPGDYSLATRPISPNVPAAPTAMATARSNGRRLRRCRCSTSTSRLGAPLASAGFINGSYTYAARPRELRFRTRPIPTSRYIQVIYDNVYGDRRAGALPPQPEDRQPDSVRHHGRNRPQDRRRQSRSAARSSSPSTTAARAALRRRARALAVATWPRRPELASPPTVSNCGGASLF